ncbi:hypothetical protein DM02DRAFT_664178 [Periconia macrospinosa]|uniref:Uncharacterized protein n=1 Tax=Periconia macrospinosa TaxID=97972 RepID=A0A2V1CZX6_9PLEO|nr:hypothetical protein DM02DRAFT_664178 [Periconia macrospinosa]
MTRSSPFGVHLRSIVFSRRLEDGGFELYDPDEHRIRCHGHVISLAVQAFFFCKDKQAVEDALSLARSQLESQGWLED